MGNFPGPSQLQPMVFVANPYPVITQREVNLSRKPVQRVLPKQAFFNPGPASPFRDKYLPPPTTITSLVTKGTATKITTQTSQAAPALVPFQRRNGINLNPLDITHQPQMRQQQLLDRQHVSQQALYVPQQLNLPTQFQSTQTPEQLDYSPRSSVITKLSDMHMIQNQSEYKPQLQSQVRLSPMSIQQSRVSLTSQQSQKSITTMKHKGTIGVQQSLSRSKDNSIIV